MNLLQKLTPLSATANTVYSSITVHSLCILIVYARMNKCFVKEHSVAFHDHQIPSGLLVASYQLTN